MSYILDALRRADAERERGAVPGLQSQQHPLLDDDEARPRPRALVWVIVALAIALAAAVAWNFVGGEPPRATPVADARPAAATPPPALPQALPTAPVATSAATLPVPAAASSIASISPPARPPAVAAASAALTARAAAPAPRRAAAPTAAANRAADDGRVLTQAELPDDLRRELPRLTVGGASYSGDAASRMVILNGQIFHEGDKVAAGLVLEKIKLKAAVLSFKGKRFQIDY